MVLKSGLAGCALLFLSACQSEEKMDTQETEPSAYGKPLYLMHCAACHGSDGTLGNSGAANLRTSTLSYEATKKVLIEGRNAMPPFEELIADKGALDSLTAYIMKFRK